MAGFEIINVQALQLVSEQGFENPDVSPSCGWSTLHSSRQHARGWEVGELHTNRDSQARCEARVARCEVEG